MRPIDADKLIEERFSLAPSGAYRDDEGELLVPMRAVIDAIRMAPTLESGEGEDADTLPQRIKVSIAAQLTHFLLCEGRQPEDVRVLVRYPGALAMIELKIDIDSYPSKRRLGNKNTGSGNPSGKETT